MRPGLEEEEILHHWGAFGYLHSQSPILQEQE